MFTSSTVIFSIGSGERKRCSNMAPVRRLRNLAWINARRLPGVRCSTLNTECRSLLCLMIMPGRSWVAGIDIAAKPLLKKIAFDEASEWRDKPQLRRTQESKPYFTRSCGLQETVEFLPKQGANQTNAFARSEILLGTGAGRLECPRMYIPRSTLILHERWPL